MQSSVPTAAPRPRRRLLRVWAVVSAAYVLIAAAASAGPLQAAVRHALAAPPAAAQPLQPAPVPGGPIPEAPDSPAEMLAKAIGLEALLLLGPPLLLLWLGWDVWFALAGFIPGLSGASPPSDSPRAGAD